MSFEELLKALEADTNKTYLQGTDESKKLVDFYLKGKRIEFQKFKRALGKWALEEFHRTKWANNDEVDKLENSDAQTAFHTNEVYKEIATACLYEAAIEEVFK